MHSLRLWRGWQRQTSSPGFLPGLAHPARMLSLLHRMRPALIPTLFSLLPGLALQPHCRLANHAAAFMICRKCTVVLSAEALHSIPLHCHAW